MTNQDQLVTSFMLESNRRKARAAVKAEMKLYRGADWTLYSKTFAWFRHKKRMDESAVKWFEATWNEIHEQLYTIK